MCQQTRPGHFRRLRVAGQQAIHHTVVMFITQRMGNRHQTTGFVHYQDALVLVQNAQLFGKYPGNHGTSRLRVKRSVLSQQGQKRRYGFRHGRDNIQKFLGYGMGKVN